MLSKRKTQTIKMVRAIIIWAIVINNSIFYFKYSDEYSETSLSNNIGIFSNAGKCNKFKDNFLNNDIGFTSKCKNISTVN